MLRKLKSGDSSSTASRADYRSERVQDFQKLYKSYEKGKIGQSELNERINDDIGITVSQDFERNLGDHSRKFSKIVQSLGLSQKKIQKSPEYYVNPQTPAARSTRELTTVASERLTQPRADTDEITHKLKLFASGDLTATQFAGYCARRNVQLDDKANKLIRQHEETASVPFTTLAKGLLPGVENKPPAKAAGDPNKRDITVFKGLNDKSSYQANPTHYAQARKEGIDREYSTLPGGVQYPKKKTAQPSYNKDNGNLTHWDKGSNDQGNVNKIRKEHVHQDIFEHRTQSSAPQECKSIRHNIDLKGSNFMSWA